MITMISESVDPLGYIWLNKRPFSLQCELDFKFFKKEDILIAKRMLNIL